MLGPPVLWRDRTNRACSRRGGKSVAMSSICRLNFVDDDAPPDVPVDRAPTRHHVYSVTGRMRFDRTDFQRPRAHRAQRGLHDRLHGTQRLDDTMFVWQFVDSAARVSTRRVTARAPREFPGLPRPVGTSKTLVVAGDDDAYFLGVRE
jgi:hypothetical protein